MTAIQQANDLRERLNRNGIAVNQEQANALRRAQLVLHRWCEQECGDGNAHSSWTIERDETTNKPYRCVYPHQGEMRRYPIADKEAGALKRIAAVCKAIGAHFYYQTDPRGCALYLSKEPIIDNDYSTKGTACY